MQTIEDGVGVMKRAAKQDCSSRGPASPSPRKWQGFLTIAPLCHAANRCGAFCGTSDDLHERHALAFLALVKRPQPGRSSLLSEDGNRRTGLVVQNYAEQRAVDL